MPKHMSKFRRNFLPVWTFFRIDIKRLFRDKTAIFFVFIFPLIFLMIFGFLSRGNGDVSFRVALLNQSKTEFSGKFAKEIRNNNLFKVDKDVFTLAQAKEKMNRGQLEATIILPADFGKVDQTTRLPAGNAKVLYDQSNQTAGQTLGTVMQGIFDDINQKLVPAEKPFSVTTQSTATKGMSQFDYTFAGILGFTMLSLGIYGPTTVFPRLKQRGILRRYHTTPLKVWQYFTGNVLSNAAVGLIALAVMLAVAVGYFDLNMRGSYLLLAFVMALGTVLMFGIGLSLGGWAKNENQAAPLAQVAALPMMFLSGVFFPVFLMPELLQKVTMFIPLTPVIEAVRLIITENASLVDLAPQLGIMAAWIVIIYFVAFKVFRWE